MIDSFVILTPVLLLGVALLGFVGCNWVFGNDPTTLAEAPAPPSNVQATPGDNRITLTWEPDPAPDRPITGFTVFRGNAPGTVKQDYESGVPIVAGQLSYIDTAAKNGITSYYRVTASNLIGESGLSEEASTTPMSPFGSFIIAVATPGTPNAAGRPGWFGMALSVVGPGSITIQKLGRAFDLGITTPHRVKIVDANSKMELGSTSVDINSPTGGYNGQFKYGDLNPPVPRAPGEDFYVLSEEFNNGDRFYEQDETVAGRPEAKVMSAMESDPQEVTYSPAGAIGHTYGPVDFQY
jgi:hypothetical protein